MLVRIRYSTRSFVQIQYKIVSAAGSSAAAATAFLLLLLRAPPPLPLRHYHYHYHCQHQTVDSLLLIAVIKLVAIPACAHSRRVKDVVAMKPRPHQRLGIERFQTSGNAAMHVRVIGCIFYNPSPYPLHFRWCPLASLREAQGKIGMPCTPLLHGILVRLYW